MYALTHCLIFTGYSTLTDHAIIIERNRIVNICPQNQLPNIQCYDLQGAMVSAGFIDLQLNGCGGVQFNESLESLSVETLHKMQQTNLNSGCTSYLPTLITSSDTFIQKAVSVMRDYLAQYSNQALGLHLEGPYINHEKKGIHDSRFIRQPNSTMIDFLCANADVIKIITLAPECVDPQMINRLSQAGIYVSIGHSNASYQQAKAGFAAGIKLATHLFNAMPPITGRMPNIVGAVYDDEAIYSGIIADGMHVDWSNIRTSYKLKKDKLFLVTDAILPTGTNLSECTFAGKTIYYRNGKCVDENGTLAGSALTMISAVKNCVEHVGLSLEEALRMATLYPAKAIGVDHELGALAVGKIANLVIFDQHFVVKNTVINGDFIAHHN